MPTFAEWEAARKGQTAVPPGGYDEFPSDAGHANPTAEGFGNSEVDRLLAEAKGTLSKADTMSQSVGSKSRPEIQPAVKDLSMLSDERYFDPNQSPATNAGMELTRTVGKAVKGAAKSPIDLVKGLLGIPGAVLDTAKTAVTHPIEFAKAYPEALGAIATSPKAIFDPNTDPEEAASLGGQLALGGEVPHIAKATARATPDIASASLRGVGRATGAVGRGAEAVGTSRIANMLSKYGPLEALMRGDVKGLVVAAAPKVLETSGQALQKAGTAIQEAAPLRGLRSLINKYLPAEAPPAPSASEAMRENVGAARADQNMGLSHEVAGKLNDVPTGKEVPYKNTKPTNKPVFQSDVNAESDALREQGFGEGAVRKLTKADSKKAADFSSKVSLEALRQLANHASPAYSTDVLNPNEYRVLSRSQQYAKADAAKGGIARTSAMDGLRALLMSLDDATNIGRNVRRGGQ